MGNTTFLIPRDYFLSTAPKYAVQFPCPDLSEGVLHTYSHLYQLCAKTGRVRISIRDLARGCQNSRRTVSSHISTLKRLQYIDSTRIGGGSCEYALLLAPRLERTIRGSGIQVSPYWNQIRARREQEEKERLAASYDAPFEAYRRISSDFLREETERMETSPDSLSERQIEILKFLKDRGLENRDPDAQDFLALCDMQNLHISKDVLKAAMAAHAEIAYPTLIYIIYKTETPAETIRSLLFGPNPETWGGSSRKQNPTTDKAREQEPHFDIPKEHQYLDEITDPDEYLLDTSMFYPEYPPNQDMGADDGPSATGHGVSQRQTTGLNCNAKASVEVEVHGCPDAGSERQTTGLSCKPRASVDVEVHGCSEAGSERQTTGLNCEAKALVEVEDSGHSDAEAGQIQAKPVQMDPNRIWASQSAFLTVQRGQDITFGHTSTQGHCETYMGVTLPSNEWLKAHGIVLSREILAEICLNLPLEDGREGFILCFNQYPKHKAVTPAINAWKKAVHYQLWPGAVRIMDAVDEHKVYDFKFRSEDNYRYSPDFEQFLRRRIWNDTISHAEVNEDYRKPHEERLRRAERESLNLVKVGSSNAPYDSSADLAAKNRTNNIFEVADKIHEFCPKLNLNQIRLALYVRKFSDFSRVVAAFRDMPEIGTNEELGEWLNSVRAAA